jgi:hypothetical protein
MSVSTRSRDYHARSYLHLNRRAAEACRSSVTSARYAAKRRPCIKSASK